MLGVRGSLVREDRAAAAAITEAVLEAQEFVTVNSDEAAEIFAPYSPVAKPDQLAAMLRSHTHNHHPVGADLRQEIGARFGAGGRYATTERADLVWCGPGERRGR